MRETDRGRDRAFAPLLVALVGLILLAGLVFVGLLVWMWTVATSGTASMPGMMPWGMAGGTFLWIVVLIVVFALLFRRTSEGEEAPDAAVEELRRAYARGDVDDEEFERRLERLQES